MRGMLVCWVALLLPVAAWADEPSLQAARLRLLHGNYAEARDLYERLARDAGHKSAAAVGLSRCWREEDKDFWPAVFERGKLFQEKYSYGDAAKAFTAALAVNPRAAGVLAARGIDALRRYQIKDAELFADQALKINPQLPDALRLKADI